MDMELVAPLLEKLEAEGIKMEDEIIAWIDGRVWLFFGFGRFFFFLLCNYPKRAAGQHDY